MIDLEVDIFDSIYQLVTAEYPDAYVSSRVVAVPASFPAVSIVESSNVEYMPDGGDAERFSAVTYTVNVYSNAGSDGKEECKAIAGIVSARMRFMNFSRTMCEPVDNAADPSIYRMVLRFTGAVSDDGLTYRR